MALFMAVGRCLGGGLVWVSCAGFAPAQSDDLNAAFVAAFGTVAPVERHVRQGVDDVALVLSPQFLAKLLDGRDALVVNETARSMRAGGAPNDAVSVVYLHKGDGGWAVQHVWFEAGGLGMAGNEGSEIRSFGGAPLYYSTTQWCGSDACSDTLRVLVLEDTGPRVLGEIKGGAIYPADTSYTVVPDCGLYKYTAVLGPPTAAAHRFSVTYEGWQAVSRRQFAKRNFRERADVVERNGTLETGLQTPDCMR